MELEQSDGQMETKKKEQEGLKGAEKNEKSRKDTEDGEESQNAPKEEEEEEEEKKLRDLWKDFQFAGAFSGPSHFRTFLKEHLNWPVPFATLRKVFKDEPSFWKHSQRHTRFKRRAYDLNGVGNLLECDLAIMPECWLKGKRYTAFLLGKYLMAAQKQHI